MRRRRSLRRRRGSRAAGPTAFFILVLLVHACAPAAESTPPADIMDDPWIVAFQCVAAGDYRWIEVDRGGALRFLRANSRFRRLVHGGRQLTGAELEALGVLVRRLPGAPLPVPPPEEPGLVVEEVQVALRSGPSVVVFDEWAEGGPWPRLLELLRQLAREPLEPLSRTGGDLLVLPVATLHCLGVDAPLIGEADLDPALRKVVEEGRHLRRLPLTTAQAQRLHREAFQGGGVVRFRSEPGDEPRALVLFLPAVEE